MKKWSKPEAEAQAAEDLRDSKYAEQIEMLVTERMYVHHLRKENEELSELVVKLANYLETATGIIEEEGGDEDDVADARALIAEAHKAVPSPPPACSERGGKDE